MARILLTGGAGYVGSHLPKHLLPRGIKASCSIACWGKLIKRDIRDAAALNAVFAAYRIDAVMHFAALAYVGELVQAPDRYYDVNVDGKRILLESMVRAGFP